VLKNKKNTNQSQTTAASKVICYQFASGLSLKGLKPRNGESTAGRHYTRNNYNLNSSYFLLKLTNKSFK